jgi:DNA-binding PucR family transcriptional regulator
LNHISQEYFIHKNTVQYKIQKIQSKTGLDVRVANDLFILYMASID